jgi:catechol 2,3-dioxygenase-like lactoylglutathione lyase family enzyme
MLTALDHIIIAVPGIEAAAAPFERLGLRLTPAMRHAGAGTENRVFFIGNGRTEMYIELLAIHDRALAPDRVHLQADIDDGPRVHSLMFTAQDLDGVAVALNAAGHEVERREVFRGDGSKICDVVGLGDVPLGGRASFLRYTRSEPERLADHAARGLFTHDFPLKRLDHVAIVAPALQAVADSWLRLTGTRVTGEVRSEERGMHILQLQVGDAIVELLGPASSTSPLASRPAGLISMAAFEVDDLNRAVALARSRGFTPSDPAAGVLPGTRVATIPPGELSGLALQLLQYV